MQYTWFASILGGLCLFAILGAFATVSLLTQEKADWVVQMFRHSIDGFLSSILKTVSVFVPLPFPAACLYLYRDDIHA